MQFINHTYYQVKDGNRGAYQRVSKLISSMEEDTLVRMSIAVWLTSAYFHPKIMYCLEQYSSHLASYSITNAALFLCIVTGMSSIFCFFLLLSHIMSIIEFMDYAITTLVSGDGESYQIPAGNSSFYAAILFAFMTLLVIQGAKQLEPTNSVKSFLIFHIATLIVGNIVYICCYLPPFMFLALFHDPLVTLSTYFIIFIVIFSTSCFCFLMVTMMLLWCTKANNTFILMRCSFVIITFTCIFAAVLMTTTFVVLLGRVNISRLLQGVILSLPLSLISLYLLKPVYNKVLNHKNLII